jgi:hypothetical protein
MKGACACAWVRVLVFLIRQGTRTCWLTRYCRSYGRAMLYCTAASPGAGVSVGGVDGAARASWSPFSRSATAARAEDRGSRSGGAVVCVAGGEKTDLRSVHRVLVHLLICQGGYTFQHPAGKIPFPFPFPPLSEVPFHLRLHTAHCRIVALL